MADGKISLNVSLRVVSPACIAGVLTSQPNFSARVRGNSGSEKGLYVHFTRCSSVLDESRLCGSCGREVRIELPTIDGGNSCSSCFKEVSNTTRFRGFSGFFSILQRNFQDFGGESMIELRDSPMTIRSRLRCCRWRRPGASAIKCCRNRWSLPGVSGYLNLRPRHRNESSSFSGGAMPRPG
jgi:hypothetical protein